MKTEEKVYRFPCACDKKVVLEKRMEVKVVSRGKSAAGPVPVDVFCHGCGQYIEVPLDGDFHEATQLRE